MMAGFLGNVETKVVVEEVGRGAGARQVGAVDEHPLKAGGSDVVRVVSSQSSSDARSYELFLVIMQTVNEE